MWSHVFFAPAIVAACARGVYDAVVLILVMVGLSVWYHREHEANATVARVELCSTTALFAYGVVQASVAPSAWLGMLEYACAAVVVATYAACFWLVEHPEAYDRWHPVGLHLVPAAWALLVGGVARVPGVRMTLLPRRGRVPSVCLESE